VYEMARRAPAYGLSAAVACMDRGGDLADSLTTRGVEVMELRRQGVLNLRLIGRLARYCQREGIHLVHSHSGCMLYAAMLRSMCPRLRVIHTDHGRHHPEIELVCAEERVAARRVNAIVSVSHTLADYLVQHVRLPPNKICVIWNGVDLDQFRPARPDERGAVRTELGIPADVPVVGTVGRLAPVKNQALLLAAVARLCHDWPALRLLVVGGGLLRGSLAQQARDLGIDGRLILAGQRGDVNRMLWAMDVFALSSNSEAMPLTLLEAISSGLRCVATTVGDLPRIAGLCPRVVTVPPRQEEALTQALAKQLSTRHPAADEPSCREAFAVDTMMTRYVRLYQQVLGWKRNPAMA